MDKQTHTIDYEGLLSFVEQHRAALSNGGVSLPFASTASPGDEVVFSVQPYQGREPLKLEAKVSSHAGGQLSVSHDDLTSEYHTALRLADAFLDGAEATVNAFALTADKQEVSKLTKATLEAHQGEEGALSLTITDPLGFCALYRTHLEPRRLSAECSVTVGSRSMVTIYVALPTMAAEVKLRGLIARSTPESLEVELMPYTRSVKRKLARVAQLAEGAVLEACARLISSSKDEGVEGVRSLLLNLNPELLGCLGIEPAPEAEEPEVEVEVEPESLGDASVDDAPAEVDEPSSSVADTGPNDSDEVHEVSGGAEGHTASALGVAEAHAHDDPAPSAEASPSLNEGPGALSEETSTLPSMFRRRGRSTGRGSQTPSHDSAPPTLNRPISKDAPSAAGAIPVLHDAPVSFDRFDTSDDTLTAVEMEVSTQSVRQRLGSMTGRSSSDLMGRRGRAGGSRRRAMTSDHVKLPELKRRPKPAPEPPELGTPEAEVTPELSESLSQLRGARRSRPRTADIMPSAIEESVRRADAMPAEPELPSPDLSRAVPESPPVLAHSEPHEEAILTSSPDVPQAAPTEEQPPAMVAAQQDQLEPEPVATSTETDDAGAGGLEAQSGSLASRPLLELLHTLYDGSATGLLKLKGPKRKVGISLRQGRVCHISEEPPREKFMLGNLLTTIGLSKHESAKAVTEAQRSKRLIGEILLKSGSVIRSQVKQGLIEQLKHRMGGIEDLADTTFNYQPGAGSRRDDAPNIDPLKLTFRGRFDFYMARSKRENDLESHRLATSWVRQKNFGRRWVARLGLTLPQQAIWEFSESGELKCSELIGKVAVDQTTANSTLFALRDLGCLEFRSKKQEEQTRETHERRFREKADAIRSGNLFEVLDVHWTAISEEIAEAYEHTKQAFDPSLMADASPLMEELAEVILPAVEAAFEQIKTKPERVAYREEMYTQDQIETAANYLVEQGEMELFKQDVKLARAKFSRAIELCPDVKAYKRKLNDTFTISGQQAARATSQKVEHVSSNTVGVMPDE